MKATLGIFLYSYLYPKVAKTMCFLLSLMFFLQQNWRRGQNSFCLEVGWRWGGAWSGTKMCTHVSKCKNDEIKGEKKKDKRNLMHFELIFVQGERHRGPISFFYNQFS
jgi:hypothetical protein